MDSDSFHFIPQSCRKTRNMSVNSHGVEDPLLPNVELLMCLLLLLVLTTHAPDLLQLSPSDCLTMPLVVDAVWAVWSIAAGVYDYFHTSAMEERIHTLENVLSIHQFVIAGLSAGLILLMTYILWRKH